MIRHGKRDRFVHLILIAPALVLLFGFFVVPALASLFYSLTDQMLVGQKIDEVSFIGFDNYVHLFTDFRVFSAFLNTLTLILAAICLQQACGFCIAILLEGKNALFRKMVHACVYSGWLMPEVVTAFIFFLLFSIDGSFNRIIAFFGGQSVAWLIDRPLAVIILAQLWSGTAFSLISYEQALSSMSGDVLDAARTDGATGSQILFFIILPSIRHTIRSNTTILTLNNLGVFGLIYMLTGGGPLFRSTNLPVLVFRNAISGSATGYGLTLTFVLFCLSMLFSLFNVRIIHARDGDET